MPRVELAGVSAGYGSTVVIKDTTLSLDHGITLLAAVNGAGKTTLLRLCAGILRPAAGHVRVLGADPYESARTRARIGYLSHQAGLDPRLTLADNLQFWARVRGYRGRARSLAVAQVMAELDLGELASAPASGLSRGQHQRAALARALLGRPELLLLDEPATGLDPSWYGAAMRVLERRVADDGVSVLLASHDPRDHAAGWQVLEISDGIVRRRRDREPAIARYQVTADAPVRVAEAGPWRIEYSPADPAEMTVTLTAGGTLGSFIAALERARASVLSVQRVAERQAEPEPARMDGRR